jgi:tonB-dependent receptor
MLKKIAIFSLILAAFSLYAEGEYEGKLQETVVTATGFSDNIENQIKNITVITAEDIQEKGYNTVEDILKQAPGVSITQTGFGSAVDIRGQGKFGLGTSGNVSKAVSSVKILIDGDIAMDTIDTSHAYVPLNTISVNDIERIEIINGGGTVLYGSGTRGGVVNIITKNRTKEGASGKVYYQNSSYGTNKLGFDTGINFNNKFIIDLGYENTNGKGYRKGEKESYDYLKGGLKYNITDNHSLKFKAARYNAEETFAGALTEAQLLKDRKQSGDLSRIEVERKEYSLGYDGKLTDNFKLSLSGYRQNTTKLSPGIPETKFKDTKKGINFKGNYELENGNIVFGYNYVDHEGSRKQSVFGTPMISVDLSKKTNSFYLLGRHKIVDKLEGTAGYRYERAEYETNRKVPASVMRVRGRIINVPGRETVGTRKDSNSAYELGLNYKYSDTGNVYVKYERGFRSPAATEFVDYAPGAPTYTLNNIKTEKFDTYELGFKDMLWNSFVSATVFHTRTNNEIYLNMDHGVAAGPATARWTFHNLKATERTGIELFAEQYFGKLRVNESFSYVNAKIKKVGEDVSASTAHKFKDGQKIPGVPSVKATLGLDYEIVDGLKATANLNYYSNAVDNYNKKIPSYSTTDLGLKYKHQSGFGLTAGVKNVFNKKYNISQTTNTFTGLTTYSPADERTYFIGASYEF